MNKFKELWGENKVLIVLGGILLICLIAIIIVTFSFFLGGSKSKYGNRTKDNDKYKITESIKDSYISELKLDESVKSVKIDYPGIRTIYITIEFVPDTALVDAQNKAAASLTQLGDELLSYYDINFILECEATEKSEGFTANGAKNAAGSALTWDNKTPIESEEE